MIHTLADIYTDIIKGKPLPKIGIASFGVLELNTIKKWTVLLNDSGIKHGDRLLILAEPNLETVAVMLVAWHKGAVVCPLPPDTQKHNLNVIAQDCNARFIINAVDNVIIDTSIERCNKGNIISYRTPPKVTGVDLALIIYTSGSTGSPKGIMLSHSNVLSAVRSISTYLHLTPEDSILSVPPLYFDYGLYHLFFSCFVGCDVVFAPSGTNPMKMMKYIHDATPSILPLVPALAVGLVKIAKALKKQFSSVRLITNTGGHLPASTINGLKEIFPNAEIMPMYGLTESKRVMFNTPEFVSQYPESCGKAMPGIEAKIFVEETIDAEIKYREANTDEIGELWVRGSSVMQNYTTGNSTAGCRLIEGKYRDDNWLATGDLFSVNIEGFFFFKGREKELVKQAGFCLYPRDIEASIESLEHIDDCTVIGTVDESGDEMACLFIRTEKNISRQGVKEWISNILDAPYIPKRIEFIKEWPLSANGKVDKKQLKALLNKEMSLGKQV